MTFIFGFFCGVAFCFLSILADAKMKDRGVSFSQISKKTVEAAKPKAEVMLKDDFETIEETIDRKYEESQ